MYVPREFAITGAPALAAFMRAHPFGVLLSAADGTPAATHLPLVVLRDGLDVVLGTHMARANPHWRELDGADVLAIFQGPHGYVSPRWYTDPQRSVPTWNYAAVHCRGRARLADAS
jgi:transcriptional regulator